MSTKRESYKDNEINVLEDEGTFQLKIGGKTIEWVSRTRGGKYESARHPYAVFSSALELAKNIIDSPEWQK